MVFQIKCKILLFWGYFWVENLGSKNPACGKEMINMKYGFTQSKRWNGKDFSQTHSDPPFSLSGQCPFKKHQRIPTETDTQGRYLEKKAPWMKCRSNSWHLGGATIHSLIRRKRLKQQEVLWPEPAGLSRAPSPFFETTTTFIALISPPPSLPTPPTQYLPRDSEAEAVVVASQMKLQVRSSEGRKMIFKM